MHTFRLCRHAVSGVSVCPSVTFVNSVKTNKHIFKLFSPSSSQGILVFPYQTAWQYSDGNPLMGASNAGAVGRNRDSEPISGFTAWCQRCDRPDVIKTCTAALPDHEPASCDTIAGSKRRSLLMSGDDDKMFMTRSLNATPKTTKFARSDKSVAYLTNSKRLCSTFFIPLKLTTDRHEASRDRFVTLRATLGDRAFPVAAARAWNSLPLETRACSSLLTFQRETKSHLFRQSYGWRGAFYSDGQLQTSALSCATVLNLDFCKVPPQLCDWQHSNPWHM